MFTDIETGYYDPDKLWTGPRYVGYPGQGAIGLTNNWTTANATWNTFIKKTLDGAVSVESAWQKSFYELHYTVVEQNLPGTLAIQADTGDELLPSHGDSTFETGHAWVKSNGSAIPIFDSTPEVVNVLLTQILMVGQS